MHTLLNKQTANRLPFPAALDTAFYYQLAKNVALLSEMYRVVVRPATYSLSIRLASSSSSPALVPHCSQIPYLSSLFFHTLDSPKITHPAMKPAVRQP